MAWYYAENEQRVGPIDDDHFQRLVNEGTVGNATLVWREGMRDWAPYGTTGGVSSASAGTATAAYGGGDTRRAAIRCVECGRSFASDEVIEYQGAYVCATCKPIFVQRIREGGSLAGEFDYGGFWIRFLAKIIDGLVMTVANFVLTLPFGLVAPPDESVALAVALSMFFISVTIPIAYTTFLVGRFGATLGKMALGLKIVRSDGDRVSYLRALGRYFAEILSALILYIGYIMAAFDDEKRALHDHICDTRVIRVR